VDCTPVLQTDMSEWRKCIMTKPKFDRLLMTIIVSSVALIVAASAGELVRNQIVRGKGRCIEKIVTYELKGD